MSCSPHISLPVHVTQEHLAQGTLVKTSVQKMKTLLPVQRKKILSSLHVSQYICSEPGEIHRY